MDDNQLYRTLFLVKDFLNKHKETGFASFDLTDDNTQIDGDSFKIPVDNEEDVLYFLRFYNLDNNFTSFDIRKLKIKKGYIGKFYLILRL
ncbi:hypothetical protein [Flavobacterium magnesitis]|uniref:hypothetical protein n=1 Tax=Flavobacterium magnesitis TaxID=3138077 RepID=UPI00358EB684